MKNLEDKLQEACVTWFRYQYPDVIIFAIPNGGSRNPIEAAKLKRTGTLAGVADLFVMKSRIKQPEKMYQLTPTQIYAELKVYYGLFIELKVGKNVQTESQELFMQKAKNAGYACVVCHSIDEFMNVVNEYMK